MIRNVVRSGCYAISTRLGADWAPGISPGLATMPRCPHGGDMPRRTRWLAPLLLVACSPGSIVDFDQDPVQGAGDGGPVVRADAGPGGDRADARDDGPDPDP